MTDILDCFPRVFLSLIIRDTRCVYYVTDICSFSFDTAECQADESFLTVTQMVEQCLSLTEEEIFSYNCCLCLIGCCSLFNLFYHIHTL